ncbi:MAG: SIR2 family protein [Chloroflexota bacterium]|nr:SIR2 family protein [Chloroflexota bacterium]
MNSLEPAYREIWDLLKAGQIIPFLGAGASLSGRAESEWIEEQHAYLPSGRELGQYLAQQVNFPDNEPTSDLAKVAQYFRVVIGRRGLRNRLHGIFAHDFPVAAVHELLAEVPAALLIVTTNYDDLIERAFKAKGRPFDLVIYPADNKEWAASIEYWKYGATEPEYIVPRKLRVDLTQTTVIYKMHGTVDRLNPDRDSFVVTEDDYTEFLVRVAKQTAIPAAFADPFRTRQFLFLGYGLFDWNFRVVLSKIQSDLASADEELPSWAITYHASQLEQELWRQRGVKIYDMSIQEFVQKLRRENRIDG